MDFIIEVIGEIIIESLFELSTNKKVPKWIRYPLLILVISALTSIIILMIYLGFKLMMDNLLVGLIIIGLATLIFILVFMAFRKKLKVNK